MSHKKGRHLFSETLRAFPGKMPTHYPTLMRIMTG